MNIERVFKLREFAAPSSLMYNEGFSDPFKPVEKTNILLTKMLNNIDITLITDRKYEKVFLKIVFLPCSDLFYIIACKSWKYDHLPLHRNLEELGRRRKPFKYMYYHNIYWSRVFYCGWVVSDGVVHNPWQLHPRQCHFPQIAQLPRYHLLLILA